MAEVGTKETQATNDGDRVCPSQCAKVTELCEALYEQSPWRYALAGAVFAAVEFAVVAPAPGPDANPQDSYHDRPISVTDRFLVKVVSVPAIEDGLQKALACLDQAHGQRASETDRVLVGIHGYVPQQGQCQQVPNVPVTPGVENSLTAMIVVNACSGEVMEVVPCFRGWPVMTESLWRKRLVLIQVGCVAKTRPPLKPLKASKPPKPNPPPNPPPRPPPKPATSPRAGPLVEQPRNQVQATDPAKHNSELSKASKASKASSSSSSKTTDSQGGNGTKVVEPGTLDTPDTPATSTPTVAKETRAKCTDELAQLYNVYHALTTKGIRIESNGRVVNKVPEDLPVLQCAVCQESVPAAQLAVIRTNAREVQAGRQTFVECTPSGFLGCAHCSLHEQETTMQRWEGLAREVVLDNDMRSIQEKHDDFLRKYNVADPSLNSFKAVAGPVDYDANCQAIRACSQWQRGKNANYPTVTFVLVDVPLKDEDLVSAKRRVKSGSSACPWNKVVVNMEVPSESMVKQGITSCKALANECPIYKVPLNKGIEEHTTKLRSQGRVRSRGKSGQTSIKEALAKRPKL